MGKKSSDNLWTSYTNLSGNLWTPYTDLGDNRHENFEEKVENEDENDFHHVHCDSEVFLHYVEISFHNSPFKTIEIRLDLMTPMDCWQNSSTIFDVPSF